MSEQENWDSLSTQEKLALINWAAVVDKNVSQILGRDHLGTAVIDMTVNGHSLRKFLGGFVGSKNVRKAWLDIAADIHKSATSGKLKEAFAKTNAWVAIVDRIRDLGQAGFDRLRSNQTIAHSSHAYRHPDVTDAAPTEDGLEKWIGEHHFISCCGIWWSPTPWSPVPNHCVGTTCSRCGKFVLRAKENPDDHSAYQQRLSETEPGSWIRLNERNLLPIAPGATQTIVAQACMTYMVSHLAIPMSVATRVRVHSMLIGTMICIDGPVPGELFAVRVPEHVKRPIDRGGSIGKKTVLYPGMAVTLQIHNKSDAPVVFEGALFGQSVDQVPLPRSHLTSGLVPIGGDMTIPIGTIDNSYRRNYR